MSWDELVFYVGGGSGAAALIFGILRRLKLISGFVDSFLRFSNIQFQKRMCKKLKEHPVLGVRGKIMSLVQSFISENKLHSTAKGKFILLLFTEKTNAFLAGINEIVAEYHIWSGLPDTQFKEYCYTKIQKGAEREDSAIKKVLKEVYSISEISKIFNILFQKGYFQVRGDVVSMFYSAEVSRIIDSKLEVNNVEKMIRIFNAVEQTFFHGCSEGLKTIKKINGELDKILV